VASPQHAATTGVAIGRLEQLYPFPADEVQQTLGGYRNLQEVVWLQEEPENMGVWTFLQPRLAKVIKRRWPLHYIGRPPNSSPAEGSAAWHAANQKALIEQAYNLESRLTEDIGIISGGN
jgi:2-oxoglutarate dehydrogenase E1 component